MQAGIFLIIVLAVIAVLAYHASQKKKRALDTMKDRNKAGGANRAASGTGTSETGAPAKNVADYDEDELDAWLNKTSSELEKSRPIEMADLDHSRLNWIVGASKQLRGKAFHVGDQIATMGRLSNNYIQLTDGDASRVHCQLRPTAQGLEIRDLGTVNGTRVNGERLAAHQARLLQPQDTIQIGKSVFVYHRRGDFGENAGETERKSRGMLSEAATAAVGGAEWKEVLERELRRAGGDVDRAARNMQLDPDVFKQMMRQLGVDADA